MKQLLMALCLAVASQVSMAQSTQTIRGHIADIASGEPIIGVAVLVDSEGNRRIERLGWQLRHHQRACGTSHHRPEDQRDCGSVHCTDLPEHRL